MALQTYELWRRGFVCHATTGALILTRLSAGAVTSGGFLRDADGRLVVSNA